MTAIESLIHSLLSPPVQYFPQLNPNAQDRKQLAEKHSYWQPVACQYDKCSSKISNEAVKMCIDYSIAIGGSVKAPQMGNWFMLVCIECADVLYKGKPRDTLIDLLLPMESISYNCENKACRSPISQKMAVATCFSIECANYNMSKPMRYCAMCNQQKHGEYKFKAEIQAHGLDLSDSQLITNRICFSSINRSE